MSWWLVTNEAGENGELPDLEEVEIDSDGLLWRAGI